MTALWERIALLINRLFHDIKSIISKTNLSEHSINSSLFAISEKPLISSNDQGEKIHPKNTIALLEKEIRDLRLATYLGKKLRYKPLLLLSVCHLIDIGEISDNKIYLTSYLEDLYKEIAISVGYGDTVDIGLPFFHLRTSPFWCHQLFPDKEQEYENHPSLGQSRSVLLQTIEYAFIHQDFSELFFKEDSRNKIINFIFDIYFTEIEKENVQNIFRRQNQSKFSTPIIKIEGEPEKGYFEQKSLDKDKNISLDSLHFPHQPTTPPESRKEIKDAISTKQERIGIGREKEIEDTSIKIEHDIDIDSEQVLLDSEDQTIISNVLINDKENDEPTQITLQELNRRVKEKIQISSIPPTDVFAPEKTVSKAQKPIKKRGSFYFDLHPIPEIEPNIVDELLKFSEQGNIRSFVKDDPIKIEEFLLNAFNRYDFIGDMPFSQDTFYSLREIIHNNFIIDSKLEINKVPPALFITSMVFCARYSEEEARKFWQPYADLIWQTDPTLNFQNKCRDHYLNSRDFLLKYFDFSFPALQAGGVVRPIYYQAIIPYYLQSAFAQWLITNFEQILQFSTTDLPSVLQKDKSLNYVPKGLKSFVTGTDTYDTAAKLITQLANAIKLFQTTEQDEAVTSIMDSPIERSLWEEIYKDLIEKGIEIEKVRSYAAKLDWVWNMETREIGLQLAQVRSNSNEKPNLIIWASKDNRELKTEEKIFDVHPWRLENGDWELETTVINEFGELDGELFVLSEQFDLEENLSDQKNHIIFHKPIPDFPNDFIYFYKPSKRQIARSKERIDVNGEWIIFSKEEFEVTGKGHQGIHKINSNIQLPNILRNAGFNHAKQYQLILPVCVHSAKEIIEFDQPSSVYIFEAEIIGEKPIDQMSYRVQPIFTSNQIDIQTFANFPIKNLQKIWVSIHQGNKFLQSISLEELNQKNLLTTKGDSFLFNLSLYIKEPGLYSINILHNLQNLLDTPLLFGFLPDVKIIGPDHSKCYSPVNPVIIQIEGISDREIVFPESEKAKKEITSTGIRLEMNELRQPEAHFSLQWDGNNIHICYDINRVTAWIDGGGDKAIVMENNIDDLVIHIRGNPYDRFKFLINEVPFPRDFYLDAKGEFNEYVKQSFIRDILRQSKSVETEIGITIKDFSWRLFKYKQSPKISIKEVKYQRPNISITLEQETQLKGAYIIQIRNVTSSAQPILIGTEKNLQQQHTYHLELEPGKYILEILLQDEVLTQSNSIEVLEEKKEVKILDPAKIHIPKSSEFSPIEIYESLSAISTNYQLIDNKKLGEPLSILKQLIIVTDYKTWINNKGKLDEIFNLLLPTWAVISHPLRVITIKPRKIMHLFPQKAVYGGKFGKGLMKVKFVDGPIDLYAAWTTNLNTNISKLWLMVPQVENITRFCDLDEYDLWPCYRCSLCGTIVGSKEGNRLKLPPKTISLHSHKTHLPLNELFVDVVYDKNIQATITQYKDDQLNQCDSPYIAINNKLIDDLLEGNQSIITGELNQPIDPHSSQDYELAIHEVIKNYSNYSHEFTIKQIIGKHNTLKKIESIIAELCFDVKAFNAFFRLYRSIKAHDAFGYLPKQILLIAMLLRYKPHYPKDYKFVLHTVQIDEKEIANLTHMAMTSCPKLLEWSIFWAEVFFQHAAS